MRSKYLMMIMFILWFWSLYCDYEWECPCLLKYKIKHMSAIYAQMDLEQGEFFICDNFSVSFRLFKIRHHNVYEITGPYSSRNVYVIKGKVKSNYFQLKEINKNLKNKLMNAVGADPGPGKNIIWRTLSDNWQILIKTWRLYNTTVLMLNFLILIIALWSCK